MRWRPLVIVASLLLPPAAAAFQEPPPDSPAGRLWAAARRGDAAETKKLLDAGVDANTPFRYGATALSYACDRGHLEVVKLLLERGARVDVRDTFYSATPFDWAMRPAMGEPGEAHVAILRLLLAKGAGSRSAILSAGVVSGRANLVKLALEGPPLDGLDLGDALDSATKGGREEIVSLLKDAGAQPLPAPQAVVGRATLERYVGEWASDGARPMKLVVELGEAGLAARFGGEPVPLGAYDERTFRTLKELPRARLTFVVEDGEVTALRVKLPGGEQLLKRSSRRQP